MIWSIYIPLPLRAQDIYRPLRHKVALDGDWESLGVLALKAGLQHRPEHHGRFARLVDVSLLKVRDRITRLLRSNEEVRKLDARNWRNMTLVWRQPPATSEGGAQES